MVAGRAGGVSTARRKQQQQKEQARRQKLQAKQDAEQAAIEAWFSKYDVSQTGTFSKEEMRTLLTDVKRKVTEDPNAVVSEGASALGSLALQFHN